MRRLAAAAVLTGVGVEEIRANTARTVELLEGEGRKPAGGAEPSPAEVSSTEAVGHPA